MRFLLAIMVFLHQLVLGQENLVPNGSFEEYSECPDQISQIQFCSFWSNPTGASPDYFNVCSEPDVFPPDTFPRLGVPENIFGTQTAKEGNAYAGAYGVQLGNQQIRDYIQAELTKPLHHRIRYAVSFYVSLSESSRYAISTLGAHLSVNAISSNDLLVLDAVPQILADPLQPITDTADWVLITDTFVSALGGERFITIGNFFSDVVSDTVFFNPEPPLGNRFAYYYIDDVSVIALDSVPSGVGISEVDELDFMVYPNPATDVLHIQSKMPMAGMRLLDMRGRSLLVGDIASDRHSFNLNGIPAGVYLLEIVDQDARRAVKKLMKE